MTISRRDLIRAGLAAAGGLALARPLGGALANPLGPSGSTSRISALLPGFALAHADLHNHSLHSDGNGDPALAFASMRSFGLDVAAMTDHSTLSWGAPQNFCPEKNCQGVAGINEQTWAEIGALADAAQRDGEFVAIRGFEWSSPTIGHMNVWFSRRWMDPLHTAGGGTGEGAAQFAHDEVNAPADAMRQLDEIVRNAPTTGAGMAAFYEWLAADPARPVWSGGADGLAQFNHPGREPGRFSNFRLTPAAGAPSNVVGIEMFNRNEDYLYEGTDSLARSPLVECLDAGWRVGITGVTDEHGTDWGAPRTGNGRKGRTGLWLDDSLGLTRAGVADALAARRFFATREPGLRFAASANGLPMGSVLGPVGRMNLEVDIASDELAGRTVQVQILRPGPRMPTIEAVEPVVVGAGVHRFTHEAGHGGWAVLRVTDGIAANADGRADAIWRPFGRALAYASPFFFAV